MKRTISITILAFILVFGSAVCVTQAGAETQFYFIRHAEFVKKDPAKPLNEQGRMRATSLVDYFGDTKLTHIYATHTDRTRDTVIPLARQHDLGVKQFPQPGSEVEGSKITNMLKGKAAIKPMTTALKKIPDGSIVVVSANSGNIFAIMANLGVRVSTKDSPCGATDESCLPCKDKSCFPKKEFHNVWKVTLADKGATMTKSQYGKVPSKTPK